MRPVLLVTGGSRGIGAAVCRLAAARGYDVGINFQRDATAAQGVAADCRAAGARAEFLQGDMAQESDIARVFADLDARLGPLTHLVNNAGIVGRASRLEAASGDMIRATVDLNVTGALIVAREAIRRMALRHGGRGGAIVNISSAAATLGGPGEYVWYAATKGAVDTMTIGLSKEVGPDGIRVNAVAPGLIDTRIHASGGDAERVARLGPSAPLGRAGTAQEVAEAVLFLLSEAACYISGAVLRVGGGR